MYSLDYVGPEPRPILSPKEELFAAELWAIRKLLTQLLTAALDESEALSQKECKPLSQDPEA